MSTTSTRRAFGLLSVVTACSVVASCGANIGRNDKFDLSVNTGQGDGTGGPNDDLTSSGNADFAPPDFNGLDFSLAASDGPGAYSELGASGDSGTCSMGQMGMPCAMPIAANAGCATTESCGTSGEGNGLDDDCDGTVDEGCSCTPGSVQRCFRGPPGKHKIGACTDGQQTCEGSEFGSWGPCLGSISPTAESCDKLDNDCNGCADDGLCCGGVLDCPGPNDPRIPPSTPYSDVQLKGGLFFTGAAVKWTWTVVGGPCDQLFSTTTGSPPQQSFTLTNGATQNATVHFTLSGDYTITMTVVDSGGVTHTCSWVQHVVGPGVRFELCWDHTGSAAKGGADLDLHVHRSGTTTPWFEISNNKINLDDCNYADCNPDAHNPLCIPFPFPCPTPVNWGYSASASAQCYGAPATQAGNTWMKNAKNCPNPRLDLDNVNIVGRPENANIDKPANNESFRAMVHYYGQDATTSAKAVEQHPIVNIYCGGTLKATYGQTPNTLGPCPGATCFNLGSGWNKGQMWRVADVKAIVNGMGDTTDCTVTAIHPPNTTSGYYVTTNNNAF